jgi:hypothetical protein
MQLHELLVQKMNIMRCFFSIIVLGIGCCSLSSCATAIGEDKVPLTVWEKLAAGDQQDLIVVFDDVAILAQASELNRSKRIMFDDADTLRFKAKNYAAIKKAVISVLPSGQVEILKDYDSLPLMFLRFRSTATLKALLENPSVVKAYEDRQENLILKN